MYVEAVAERHDVFLHAFADDTQIYLHGRRVDTASAAAQLERCITDVGHWMSANRLKLNTDKAELLWVGSRHSYSQQGGRLPVLHLGHDSIEARDHVRLLGVTLSSDLSLDRHANIVSATSFYWLRQLRRCVLDSHWTRIQRLYTRSCIRIVTRRPLQCCIGRRPKSDD